MRRLAAALLLVPLAAAACGGSGKKAGTTAAATGAATTASPAAAVEAAVKKTVQAGSEHVQLTAKVSANGQNVSLTGAGDFDSSRHLGKMHANLALGGIKAQVDEVQTGSTVYVGSDLFTSLTPGGQRWLKLDLATAAKTLGANASVLTAQDPSSALAQLSALTGVTKVGTETIGGVQTTHYKGQVDVSKLPPASAQLAQSTGASFGPVDVWVGDDGYVHRMHLVTNAGSGGQTATTTATMTLSAFGESVTASPPPASKTVDATKVSIPGLTG